MTEFEIIKLLTKGLKSRSKGLIKGVGDDCAVIDGPSNLAYLLTTDALVEGVHFNAGWMTLENLGAKALAVNLSDIAAMGGEPKFFLVSIGLPKKTAAQTSRKIYSGMLRVARKFGVELIGGDTVASPKGIVISITVVGQCEKKEILLRSGATAPQPIYVTGKFGSSGLGLRALRAGVRKGFTAPFISKHLNPFPRLAEARLIAVSKMAGAMIDSSDGLYADLSHIADESGVGFTIEMQKIPVAKNLYSVANKLRKSPTDLILAGGEDYELIFTVKSDKRTQFEKFMQSNKRLKNCVRCIGRIEANPKIRRVIGIDERVLKINNSGYDHFASS